MNRNEGINRLYQHWTLSQEDTNQAETSEMGSLGASARHFHFAFVRQQMASDCRRRKRMGLRVLPNPHWKCKSLQKKELRLIRDARCVYVYRSALGSSARCVHLRWFASMVFCEPTRYTQSFSFRRADESHLLALSYASHICFCFPLSHSALWSTRE